MPGIKGARHKAAEMALAGSYGLRIHRDEVVIPPARHLRTFEISGLSPTAETVRAELGIFLEEMERLRSQARGMEGTQGKSRR